VSETLDWARTLILLGVEAVDEQVASETINILLKYQSDINKALREFQGTGAESNKPWKNAGSMK
jgi:hypothetical protein